MPRNAAVETALNRELSTPTDPSSQALRAAGFAIRDLSVLAYANGFTLWHYRTGEQRPETPADFFDDAADMMAVGDLIMITGLPGASIVAVLTASQGSVTVGPIS